VVDFVENDLEDLICSGLSATQGCGATAATHRQDGPFLVKLGKANGPLDVMSSLPVEGLTAETGTTIGDRVGSVVRVKVIIIGRLGVPPAALTRL